MKHKRKYTKRTDTGQPPDTNKDTVCQHYKDEDIAIITKEGRIFLKFFTKQTNPIMWKYFQDIRNP
jgi:hypothetical protein